jgi:hypothetical protein
MLQPLIKILTHTEAIRSAVTLTRLHHQPSRFTNVKPTKTMSMVLRLIILTLVMPIMECTHSSVEAETQLFVLQVNRVLRAAGYSKEKIV